MIYRKLDASEHGIQSAFIRWVRMAEKMHPALQLMFAVPNGGKRSVITAVLQKAEGVRKGVPDIMLPVPRHGFTGLAIEFKKPGGRLSEDQVEYIQKLVEEDWIVDVLTDAEDAIKVVKKYLDIKG